MERTPKKIQPKEPRPAEYNADKSTAVSSTEDKALKELSKVLVAAYVEQHHNEHTR
jgi:hypothetical protein